MANRKSSKAASRQVGATAPVHLHFLDGVRGLAALYVVFHHAFGSVLEAMQKPDPHSIIAYMIPVFQYHRIAVGTFIVLSGYCLMHSVLLNDEKDFQIRNGLKSFWVRRARRILPAYYAAVVICILLAKFVPALATVQGSKWDSSLPIFKPGVLLSHLFLVHNVNADWAYKIDYPLWSIATEWQIYFAFPLLLIGFRRAGVYLTVLMAFVVGWGIVFAAQKYTASLIAAPWYLGFFAMGAACAILKSRLPLPRLVVAPMICFAFWFGINFTPTLRCGQTLRILIQEMCVGLGAVLMIWYLCRWSTGWAARFLSTPICHFLGRISYSLYVIHAPVLAICFVTARRLEFDPGLTLLMMLTASVALSIAVAYGLFKAVEQPFMTPGARIRTAVPPVSPAT